VIGADKLASLQTLVGDVAVYGADLFRNSARSAEELYWNYIMIMKFRKPWHIPAALVVRLQMVSELRQAIES
jgi:hypothetical protein